MTKNQIAIYWLNNSKKLERSTGYAYARNGAKLRALFPERELQHAMTRKYGIQM